MTVYTTLRIYAIMFTKFKAVDQYRITTRDVLKKTNVQILRDLNLRDLYKK